MTSPPSLKILSQDKTMPKLTCSFCRICGRQPQTKLDEMNIGPVRFWNPDEGWKIGALCRPCHEETKNDKPKPDDYAFHLTNDYCDSWETDEDFFLGIVDPHNEEECHHEYDDYHN
jgi:hypothetical protein